jgi:hypothetical protein
MDSDMRHKVMWTPSPLADQGLRHDQTVMQMLVT